MRCDLLGSAECMPTNKKTDKAKHQHSITSFGSGLFDLGFKLVVDVVAFAVEMRRKVNPVQRR